MRTGKLRFILAVIFSGTVILIARAEDRAEVKMSLLPIGAIHKAGSFRSHELRFFPQRPSDVKKMPELAAPFYAHLDFDGSRLVVLDAPKGQPSKLYIDANA